MANESPHQMYVQMLMERVKQDRYPSSSDLDRIERSMTTGSELGDYLQLLFENMQRSNPPSSQIMNRVERLLGQIPSDR
jgi:hypothetical protein